MAKETPRTIGTGTCGECGKPVAIKKNKAGRPYYNCDSTQQSCGFRGEHMWASTAAKVLQRFEVQAGSETPEKPEKTEPPAPKKSGISTLFG